MRPPIKVLIVDDQAMVREILSKGLSMDPGIEVVATAADPFQARDRIIEHQPEVMTLDVEMPRMDGVEFLRRLMPQHPIPTIMVSSLTERSKKITMDALQAGAVDFVLKPSSDVARGLNYMLMELRTKIKIAASINVSHWKHKKKSNQNSVIRNASLAESTDKVIAIGASTGGTEAIKNVTQRFSVNTPGVVIVQHMPAGFTKMFAERLNTICQMEVKEAENNDRIMPGRILLAPGGFHMSTTRRGGFYHVEIKPGDLVNGHCPSVEVLFQSVAKNVGANAIGVMLTGMGGDGADGMKAMRDSGARNFAQDEKSCVVFGMPKVAWEKGGAESLVPLEQMAETVINALRR